MKIDNNCIVSIHYALSNDNGDQLDQSPKDEPLVYLHGAAGVLPALEAELEGKSGGDQFDVTIQPSDGFGEHQPALIQQAPLSAFPNASELEVGMNLVLQTPDGMDQQVVITAIDGDSVTVDANHPLAGMTLRFQGNVAEVRAASDEEIQHWPNPVPA